MPSGKAERQVIRRFEIGRVLHRFADEFVILLRIELVGDDAAAAVAETQFAAVMFPGAVRGNEAHEQRREIAEDLDFL